MRREEKLTNRRGKKICGSCITHDTPYIAGDFLSWGKGTLVRRLDKKRGREKKREIDVIGLAAFQPTHAGKSNNAVGEKGLGGEKKRVEGKEDLSLPTTWHHVKTAVVEGATLGQGRRKAVHLKGRGERRG